MILAVSDLTAKPVEPSNAKAPTERVGTAAFAGLIETRLQGGAPDGETAETLGFGGFALPGEEALEALPAIPSAGFGVPANLARPDTLSGLELNVPLEAEPTANPPGSALPESGSELPLDPKSALPLEGAPESGATDADPTAPLEAHSDRRAQDLAAAAIAQRTVDAENRPAVETVRALDRRASLPQTESAPVAEDDGEQLALDVVSPSRLAQTDLQASNATLPNNQDQSPTPLVSKASDQAIPLAAASVGARSSGRAAIPGGLDLELVERHSARSRPSPLGQEGDKPAPVKPSAVNAFAVEPAPASDVSRLGSVREDTPFLAPREVPAELERRGPSEIELPAAAKASSSLTSLSSNPSAALPAASAPASTAAAVSEARVETRAAPQIEAAIEQLTGAREAGRTARPELSLQHQEFGTVQVRLEATASDLRATLANRDPGFLPAVQAALAERAVVASSESSSSQSQRGQDSSSNSSSSNSSQQGSASGQGSASEGRYGSSTGSGQASSQPYWEQSSAADDEGRAAQGERSATPDISAARSTGLFA